MDGKLATCLMIILYINTPYIDCGRANLKDAIKKLKLFASKLEDGACKERNQKTTVQCAPEMKNSKLVIDNSIQPSYKQCALSCLLCSNQRTKTKRRYSGDYVPVFPSDPFNEIINCNLRARRVSESCQTRILVPMQRMGSESVHFPGERTKLSWFAAQKYCSIRGLVLAEFDTKYQINALMHIFSDLVRTKYFTLWTGGSNLNNGNKLFWYDSGQQIDADLLGGTTNSGKSAQCVYTVVNSRENPLFQTAACSTANVFLCKVPKLCFYQKCKTKAQMKATLTKPKIAFPCSSKACSVCSASKSSKVKDESPEKLGRFFAFNGKKYFASHVRRTAEEAHAFCCRMQMILWTWKSADEGERMMDVLIKIGFEDIQDIFWFVNGRDENCDENFNWCDKPKRLIGSEYPWMDDQPDNFHGFDSCVIFGGNSTNYGLSDYSCIFKFFFICESQEPMDGQNTYLKFSRDVPSKFEATLECKENRKCIKPKKAAEPDGSTGYIFQALSRTYYISKDYKYYWSAFDHCCAMGMHMATIDTWEVASAIHFTTMRELQNARVAFISTIYSKNDENYWCSNDKPVDISKLPFTPSDPDNAVPPEVIMVYTVARESYGVGDGSSLGPWAYICQTP